MILGTIKRFAQKLGIDKAIGYTAIGRVVQGAGGVISVIFVAKYLSGIEQGFYYTFASILAIQIFFELGLGNIITQYVAHENTHLSWDKNSQVSGDEKHISRLTSLLKFCLKWYFILAIILVVVLAIVGTVYFNIFSPPNESVAWATPWIMLCIGTTLNFLIAPITAFLEGLGRVKEIAQYRFWTQLVIMLLTWSGLILGAKLFVGGIASITSALGFAGCILFSPLRKIILTLLRKKVTHKVDYRKEIFPYQWRIALSWVSGYFIFQLFNPVLFAYSGAAIAGQMGMTLAIINGISSISMSWISTKVPLFSGLIAKKEYKTLDTIFNRTTFQLLFICISGLLVFLIGVFMLDKLQIPERSRLLPNLPLVLMCISILINQLIYAWATYLRCHKQEPLLTQSIVLGVLTGLSTFILGKYYGVNGITIGYVFLTTFIAFPWVYKIFKKKKELWHLPKNCFQ